MTTAAVKPGAPPPKPTIYIPVEIKARELKAKVLLSMIAAQHGFRVYLGSKRAIDDLVEHKAQKGGIYFYKGGKPAPAMQRIKQKTDYFVVLDEEMGPAVQDLDNYYKGRIYPGTEPLVDRILLIGKSHLDSLHRVRPELGNKAVVTGWPRVDLWRPEMKNQFEFEVSDIRSKHGHFLLFSSDFGVISEPALEHELRRLDANHYEPSERNRLSAQLKAAFDEFLNFVSLAEELDADPSFPPLIIRPHPSEDIAAWKSRLHALKKTKIIYEGEISPWLHASNGLLHRGCTTAVQAGFAGVPAIYVLAGGSTPKKSTLPYRMSHIASNRSDLLRLASDAFNGTLPLKTDNRTLDEIRIEPELASEIIARELELLATPPEPPFRLPAMRSAFRMLVGRLDEIRTRRKIGLSKRRLTKINRKIPGGIHEPEVSKIAVRLGRASNLSIREVDFNAIEIDMA